MTDADDPTGEHGPSDAEARDRKRVADELRERSSRTRVVELEGHHRGEAMTLGQRTVYAATWWFTNIISRLYFRTKVWGKGNVPATGSFIVAPIHRSNLDTPLISAITRTRRLRYMGKESLWKSKYSAWFFSMAGGFPVSRGSADRDALRACMEVAERGEPLVMFPEGTRQSGPVVCEMFDGPAYIACRQQVPILPIGLGGTEAAMPKGRRVPPPQQLTIVVGTPILPPPPTNRGRVSRHAVKDLTERLRVELQALFDEAQEKAGTPNPPRDDPPRPAETDTPTTAD